MLGILLPSVVAGNGRGTPAKKSVINMIWLLLSVSDWLIIVISPGGLLIVVPHVFGVQVSVLWVGLPKK